MRKKWLALFAILLLALGLCSCGNPIKKLIGTEEGDTGITVETPVQGNPETAPQSPENSGEKEETDTDDALRTELAQKMEEKIGGKDPMSGDVYRYALGDRVTDANGREYFYGRWSRTIHDLDSGKDVESLVAEFFITPDGTECYIGNYFPENAGNGETVVLTEENIFDPANGFTLG